MSDQTISYRALFAVVYTTSVSSVYFALGVVAHRADGLTPVVFLAAGIFFQLTAMTYAEGAALHPERGGSAVFARYAFNELISFVAGWAIVLDYTILVAVTAITVPSYLAIFWAPIGRGSLEIVVALAVIAFVALDNLTGVSARRLRRRVVVTGVDLITQAIVIVLGLVLRVRPAAARGRSPSRHRSDRLGPDVRAADRRDRLHRPRGGRQSGRRGPRDPEAAAPLARPRQRRDRAHLRRHRARRRRLAAGSQWPDRARRAARARAGARGRLGVPPPLAGQSARVPGGHRRRARPAGRGGLLDAGRESRSATRWPPTARSPVPWGACIRASARPTW